MVHLRYIQSPSSGCEFQTIRSSTLFRIRLGFKINMGDELGSQDEFECQQCHGVLLFLSVL